MHESSLLTGIMRQLQTIAEENDASRISGVTIRLGALSNISADHFRHHFQEAVAGSIAESAKLEIEMAQDLTDPHAQDIMLLSLDLEYPE